MAKRLRLDGERVRIDPDVEVLRLQLAFERLRTEDAKADADETARIRAENRRLRAEVKELKEQAIHLKNHTSFRETISLLKYKYAGMRDTVESLLGERYAIDLDASLSDAWVESQ
jgi:hypothetical protein